MHARLCMRGCACSVYTVELLLVEGIPCRPDVLPRVDWVPLRVHEGSRRFVLVIGVLSVEGSVEGVGTRRHSPEWRVGEIVAWKRRLASRVLLPACNREPFWQS